MSQNAHTLLLFFKTEQQHNDCLLQFKNLYDEHAEKARFYADRLGVDASEQWNDVWFNQHVAARREFIRVDYETGTGEDMPLELLRDLFAHGLHGAVLDTFFDQVGESARYHFLDNQLVNKEALYEALPQAKDIVMGQIDDEMRDDEEYEEEHDEDEELESDTVSVVKPVPIDQLIKDGKRREKEALEVVDVIRELGKASRESGANPMHLLKGALVVRAALKGLLHAVLFGVVTILLFKGLWLWITLTGLAVIGLPLIYAGRELSELGGIGEAQADAD